MIPHLRCGVSTVSHDGARAHVADPLNLRPLEAKGYQVAVVRGGQQMPGTFPLAAIDRDLGCVHVEGVALRVGDELVIERTPGG